MSIIQRIRDKAALLMFILIAVSLIAFILQDAFLGSNRGSSRETDILKVEDYIVSFEEFDKILEYQIKNKFPNANTQSITQQERYELLDNIWNQYKVSIALKELAEKSNIISTSKEIEENLFGESVSQEIKNIFSDPKTGVFNPDRVKQYLKKLKRSKNIKEVENFKKSVLLPLSESIRSFKMSNILRMSQYKPTWKENLDSILNTTSTDVSFVRVLYNSIPDSLITVTKEDIKNYVENQKKTYIVSKVKKEFKYVLFPIKPTFQDSLQVLEIIKKAEKEFKENKKNFLTLRKYNSEIIDISYFKEKDIPFENKSIIKNISKNQVSPVFYEKESFFCVKQEEKRLMADTVHCRHILVSTTNPQTRQQVRTDSAAISIIDSIQFKLKIGIPFETLVTEYSEDQGSKNTGGEYFFSYTQYRNLDKSFANFIFSKPKGYRDTIKTSFGYHVIEILDKKNPSLAYKLAIVKKTLTPSQKTYDSIAQQAITFSSNIKTIQDFEQSAKKLGYKVNLETGYDPQKFTVSKLEFNRSFTRWLDETNTPNKLSPLISLDKDYIVAIMTNVKEEGVLDYKDKIVDIKKDIRQQKKLEYIVKKIEGKKSLKDIAQELKTNVIQKDKVGINEKSFNVVIDPVFQYSVLNKKTIGNIQGPIKGNLGIYIIKVDKVYADTTLQYKPNFNPFESYFAQTASMNSFNEYLLKTLDVEDKVKTFY